MYNFITETYRDLQNSISGIHQDLNLIEIIIKYKKGVNEVYTKALESYSMCYQLAQNIVRTMDIFKELCTSLPDLEEYNYRMCEIMAIFIAYELRLSADASRQEQLLIAQRIIYIMRRHLVQEEEHETSLNILRTLVYIPKLFNARDIMCAIFSEFIAIKPLSEVKVLPDKIYMLYIIVFFRWMMMQKEDDDKQLIVNFAEIFMKPSVSLCSNNLYGAYLPLYSKHSTATRTILNNLKFYTDIRNACIIDNALKKIAAVVNLCDDDEDDVIFVDTSSTTEFGQTFAGMRSELLSGFMSNIKLEEKTVINIVDLTAEDEPLNSKTSVNKLHDKWLNDFQNLAKQYRESQLLLEKQQNKQLVSNKDEQIVISLESDSEEELVENSTVREEEASTVKANKKNKIEEEANKKKNQEEFFSENYPLTNISLNCDSELESLNADDEIDDTKLSAKCMHSNLRTYQAKKPNLCRSDDKKNVRANQPYTMPEINETFRNNSVHIPSTPPNEELEEDGEHEKDIDQEQQEGNENQTEDNDPKDYEHQSYTFLSKANEIADVNPMGRYLKYNRVHNDKVAFSQSLPSYSPQSVLNQCNNFSQLKSVRSNSQQQFCPEKHDKSSDNFSELKASKKQKRVVRFSRNPEGPALQQTKYTVSDAPGLYHSHNPCIDYAPTTCSTKESSTIGKCKNHSTFNLKKLKTHNIKCLKLYKNSSALKQNFFNILNKLKPLKNVKINLKRIKLDKDTALTNFKNNNFAIKQKLGLTEDNLNNTYNINCTTTESCKLKTCDVKRNTNSIDNDSIFKKPLPVAKKPLPATKRAFITPQPLNLEKVVPLRRCLYGFKPTDSLKPKATEEFNGINQRLQENSEKCKKINSLNAKQSTNTEAKVNLVENLGMESSADEINSKTDMKNNTNMPRDTKEINKNAEQIIIQSDLVVKNVSEGIKQDQISVKGYEKKSERLSRNVEEIKRYVSLSNELIPVKSNSANSNILNNIETNQKYLDSKTQSNHLKCSKIGNNCTSLNNGKTNLLHSENFVNEPINENETLAARPLDINYGEKVQVNESKEKESSSEVATNLKNDDIANPKNTFDVPIAIPLTTPTSQWEADKLLEDFNHKRDDIVRCSLNRQTISADISIMKNSCDNINETEGTAGVELFIKKGREPDNKSTKDCKIIKTAQSENTCIAATTLTTSKDLLSRHENDANDDVVCQKSLKRVRENDLKLGKHIKKQCHHKTMPSSNDCFLEHISSNISGKYNTVQMALECKTIKNVKKAHKKSKFSNNVTNDNEKQKQNSGISSKEEHQRTALKVENTGDIEKSNQNPKDELNNPLQMETSINENQHMTVELGKWQEDRKNTQRTNGSEVGSVSAIFSFPKIPVIAISIHTTPNNKTYFKISNRGNDNHTKDGGKVKNIKCAQPENNKKREYEEENLITESISKADNQTVCDSVVKELKSPQKWRERALDAEEGAVTSTIDDKEPINVENTKENKNENHDDEEEDDIEKCQVEEGGEFNDGDNGGNEIGDVEIEKYSHDSSSACSLPLKKRPTQAENNCDTGNSIQTTGNYDLPQEIAAEVVIENTYKDKFLSADNTLLYLQEEGKFDEMAKTEEEPNKGDLRKTNRVNDDIDDNKLSNSSACFKNLPDLASLPFKRRGAHTPVRPSGQTPIQIVVPQLKENSVSPNYDHRITDSQASSMSRMSTQSVQPLPESYPATPMLSVANVEKLMDFNRFIEDLLASPDVLSIIDNANACGYYAERQAYELERIAILEHYNIANAKGSTTITKPLYWKKSAGDTISIFNDNDNEWISLPPSTAKQLQKLSFVMSILQQQYKVSDVRQRINIALAFLIRNTSKFKNTSTSNALQQRQPLYSRNISDLNYSNHNNSQLLQQSSYFRVASNNETLNNTNFNMNSSTENAQDLQLVNNSNNQQQSELSLQQESTVVSNLENWKNAMYFASSATTTPSTEQTNSVNSPQRLNNLSSMESEEPSHLQTLDKRSSSWDEINTDQLYINPPCATSPQNEVIVNTNGVELLEIPQDAQNIFISITDESGTTNPGSSAHKYNARQQSRVSEDQGPASLSSSRTELSAYSKRTCLTNNPPYISPTQFLHHNVIPTFGNQEISLQNPYRVQHHNVNTNSNLNISERNVPQQNSSMNLYNNNQSSTMSQRHLKCQQESPSRYSSLFNTQFTDVNSQQSESKINESNFKEILQPYITYLIKDHEKTSKHLLQVFEEVSNSDTSTMTVINNLNQNQQLNSLLPPLIRNPQQNHMPGFHQSTDNNESILPSLIRNPHQGYLINRDSGALQVVQSFIEQSQTSYKPLQQQITSSSSSFEIPEFAKEYINFIGTREKLRVTNKTTNVVDQSNPPETQLDEQLLHQQQQLATQCLNSVKRKYQERNDKLGEDLKRKIIEFSKHNVHAKLDVLKPVKNISKGRGRPKKLLNKTPLSLTYNNQSKCASRATRRKETKKDIPTSTTATSTIDHAYFRQRSAARRINATVNSN